MSEEFMAKAFDIFGIILFEFFMNFVLILIITFGTIFIGLCILYCTLKVWEWIKIHIKGSIQTNERERSCGSVMEKQQFSYYGYITAICANGENHTLYIGSGCKSREEALNRFVEVFADTFSNKISVFPYERYSIPIIQAITIDPSLMDLDSVIEAIRGEFENRNRHSMLNVVTNLVSSLRVTGHSDSEISNILVKWADRELR